ncbi:MAG: efflux RND transporter periplasmic adaptor subunit [Bacteroidia bacterium]
MKFEFNYKTLFFLVLSSYGVSCGNKETANNKEAENNTASTIIELSDEQIKTVGLQTAGLEEKNISGSFRVNGLIDVPPQNMVSVSMPLGGYLKSTKLLPGMHINKGEVIAVMEDQQYIQLQQDYLTAKARFVYLENEFKRQKDLNASKASSDKVFQQAEADYLSQKINIRSLEEKLKLIGVNPQHLNENNMSKSVELRAPIDGFVSKVDVNIGKYVSPTEVLFELVNPTDIHLSLTVFEADLPNVFIGQKVLAFTNNNPSKMYPCEVILIGKDLSAERYATIHCHFEQYDKTLSPGTFMNAMMETEHKTVKTLPEDAIVQHDNKSFVFVQREKNVFELVEVKTGMSEKGSIEILMNKPELQKSKFVVKGAYSLLMKLKNTVDE